MSAPGAKRSAPDTDTIGAQAQTLPPNLRSSYGSTSQAIDTSQPPISSELIATLSTFTQEQLVDMLTELTNTVPEARRSIETRCTKKKEAMERAQRQAQQRRARALQKKATTLPDFNKVIDRVVKYMEKDTSYSQAMAVTDKIEKILDQILDRCPAEAPLNFRRIGLAAMLEILYVMVFGGASLTARECRQNEYGWEVRLRSMWGRFTPLERPIIANDEPFVSLFVETAMAWKSYCVLEDDFHQMLMDMKAAGDPSLHHLYPDWERSRKLPSPAA